MVSFLSRKQFCIESADDFVTLSFGGSLRVPMTPLMESGESKEGKEKGFHRFQKRRRRIEGERGVGIFHCSWPHANLAKSRVSRRPIQYFAFSMDKRFLVHILHLNEKELLQTVLSTKALECNKRFFSAVDTPTILDCTFPE